MNNLGDNMPAQTPHKILISVLGLSEYECRLVRSVLSLSSTSGRAHAYVLLDCAAQNTTHDGHVPHIVILDPNNQAASDKLRQFSEQAKQFGQPMPAELLITHAAPLEAGKHFLLRPLAPTKMLGLLDQIADRVDLSRSQMQGTSSTSLIAAATASTSTPASATNSHPASVSLSPAAAVTTTSMPAFQTPVPNLQQQANGAQNAKAKPAFRALVVDDSPTVRIKIESELLPMGVTSDCAESGEQALAMMAKNEYDIVFLDIVLPGTDGYEVCRKIKHNRDTKRVPVIMLTSKSSPFDRIRGSLAGCSTYLTKPVDHANFHAVVEKYLAQVIAQRIAVKDHGVPVFA